MQHPGWVLVIVGVLIAVIGLVWLFAPSIPWLGKLKGDIAIERESFLCLGDVHSFEPGADRHHVASAVFHKMSGLVEVS